ncbi:MAG: hypothetical protein R2880_03960 [Deinococcales bacterium]
MVQEWSSTTEFLNNLPLVQMLREEWHAKGMEDGIEKGIHKSILDALSLRFKLDEITIQTLGADLATFEHEEALKVLFSSAILSNSLEEFKDILAKELEKNV